MRPDIVPANFKLAIYGNQFCTADAYLQCHNMAGALLHTQNESVRAGLIAGEIRAGNFQRHRHLAGWW